VMCMIFCWGRLLLPRSQWWRWEDNVWAYLRK
jgi:hypothetical protein